MWLLSQSLTLFIFVFITWLVRQRERKRSSHILIVIWGTPSCMLSMQLKGWGTNDNFSQLDKVLLIRHSYLYVQGLEALGHSCRVSIKSFSTQCISWFSRKNLHIFWLDGYCTYNVVHYLCYFQTYVVLIYSSSNSYLST